MLGHVLPVLPRALAARDIFLARAIFLLARTAESSVVFGSQQ
jgi:hypothetical protein